MNLAQRIGAIYRVSNQLTPILLFLSLVTNFSMFVMLRQRPMVVSSNVLVHDKGGQGSVRLECDTGSEGRQQAAIDTVERVMKVLYEYEKGKKEAYVARYQAIFPEIETDSPAERIIRQMAEQRGVALETSSASFTLDRKLTRAVLDNGIMYVALNGTWETKTVKGPTSEPIKLDLTLIPGVDNASFKVRNIIDHK